MPLILECTDKSGKVTYQTVPSEMTPTQAAERLGILGRPWTIRAYPEGYPSRAEIVQTYRDGKITRGT